MFEFTPQLNLSEKPKPISTKTIMHRIRTSLEGTTLEVLTQKSRINDSFKVSSIEIPIKSIYGEPIVDLTTIDNQLNERKERIKTMITKSGDTYRKAKSRKQLSKERKENFNIRQYQLRQKSEQSNKLNEKIRIRQKANLPKPAIIGQHKKRITTAKHITANIKKPKSDTFIEPQRIIRVSNHLQYHYTPIQFSMFAITQKMVTDYAKT